MIITNKKLRTVLGLIAVIGVLIGVHSCGLIEPQDSEELANQLPETFITSGPIQNSTFSYYVRIAWKGEDYDGLVKSYNLAVNNPNAWVSVTVTDSTFYFSTEDTAAVHTVYVAAVDEKGGVDPTPASLTFTAKNILPETRIHVFDDDPNTANPREGSTFGFAQKFTIEAIDPDNGPEFQYRYKIDETSQWSAWLKSGVVEFYEGSPFGLLPVGSHTFFAQVKDTAGAVDPTPATYSFVVSNTVKPSAVLTATINNLSFYPDSSAFYNSKGNNTVKFALQASAASYYGRYLGAKIKLDDNPESDWTLISEVSYTNLTPDEYHKFSVKVKDKGGVESDVVSFKFILAKPSFASGVLVVDDGDGRFAGNPSAVGDQNADKFYSDVLTAVGATFTLWDIKAQGVPTPRKGIGNYSTVIWEADESFLVTLVNQTRLASEYLSLGGNMWICGWKPIQQIAGTTPVPNLDPEFPGSRPNYGFLYNYLKLASLNQTTATPDFTGATGLESHPDINVDAAKNFLPTAANKIAPTDMFTLRANIPEAKAIYTYVSASNNPDYQGQITGIKYLGTDYKVVVFGFPFYHMKLAEATEAARKIMTDLGEI